MKNQRIPIVVLSSIIAAMGIAIVLMCCRISTLKGKVAEYESTASMTNAVATARTETAAADWAAPAKQQLQLNFPWWCRHSKNQYQVHSNFYVDLEAVRKHVKCSPEPKGFSISQNYCEITVHGEFEYATDYTITFERGLAAWDESVEPLGEDIVFKYNIGNATPDIGFADSGRYLPLNSSRIIGLSGINVSNVTYGIARVPPANIVSILSLSEDMMMYTSIYTKWWLYDPAEDDRFVRDFAPKFETSESPFPFKLNEKTTSSIRIGVDDGQGPAGTYLVVVSDKNGRKSESRMVCVTDMALSVRSVGNKTIVFVTSLSTGGPVANCKIDVYSDANVLLASGVTDGRGVCECECDGKEGVPFAIVASNGGDSTFVQMAGKSTIEERPTSSPAYMENGELEACVWTERGIYRHGETVFVQAIVRDRDGKAPADAPAMFVIKTPDGKEFRKVPATPDANGVASYTGFSVPQDMPSGTWTIEFATPDSTILGSTTIAVEEFALPQVRVKVDPNGNANATNFSFKVAAEYLYGAPASDFVFEGAVVFEDIPMSMKGWDGYRFGDESAGLRPSYRKLCSARLDAKGRATVPAPILAESGRPKAMVRATAQAKVFENGGRPATARASANLHCYGEYVGAVLAEMTPPSTKTVSVAIVGSDGKKVAGRRKLKVSLKKVLISYSYVGEGKYEYTSYKWKCDRTLVDIDSAELETADDGTATYSLPALEFAEYRLRIEPVEDKPTCAFDQYFCITDEGAAGGCMAMLSDPARVEITSDKDSYAPGETPRLLLKAPFAGQAYITLVHGDEVVVDSFKLENPSSEIALCPMPEGWYPNAEVFVNVVQAAKKEMKGQTMRSHGYAALKVTRPRTEVPVALGVKLSDFGASTNGGFVLSADVTASSPSAVATEAVVTVVDEGVNMLTGQVPVNPVAFFGRRRISDMVLYDVFHSLIPALNQDIPGIGGVKIGGDMGAEMLGRVSPVVSRRFKPVCLWQEHVRLTDGKARVSFHLPDFAGEVRVTAVAYSPSCVGSASVQKKIAPKLVALPDAPRFASPGDEFEYSLAINNNSGVAGEATYNVVAYGCLEIVGSTNGKAALGGDGSELVTFRVRARDEIGQGKLVAQVNGLGEKHEAVIELPVRPASAWRQESGVFSLAPGNACEVAAPEGAYMPDFMSTTFTVGGSKLTEYLSALSFLADYPYGCLEQTTSRIFPLVTAGGIWNSVDVMSGRTTNRVAYVKAGVRRVESMMRGSSFVMWPDTDYTSADKSYSLYAAHFLVEAAQREESVELGKNTLDNLATMLREIASNYRSAPDPAAYAIHTLALMGKANEGTMLELYDTRSGLSLLSRARLARAFARTGHADKARELLGDGELAPTTIDEAAFLVLALVDVDPADKRLPGLVKFLEDKRSNETFCWGTTGENAKALLAIGAYYSHVNVEAGDPKVVLSDGTSQVSMGKDVRHSLKGAATAAVTNVGPATAYVTWSRLSLQNPKEIVASTNTLSIRREFFNAKHEAIDVDDLRQGDTIIERITICNAAPQCVKLSDLIVEDLVPAAFEPMSNGAKVFARKEKDQVDWVMRSEARDDRVLVFSKEFSLEEGKSVFVENLLNVVSPGEFVMPAARVEAMYAPSIWASTGTCRIKVSRK